MVAWQVMDRANNGSLIVANLRRHMQYQIYLTAHNLYGESPRSNVQSIMSQSQSAPRPAHSPRSRPQRRPPRALLVNAVIKDG